MKEKTLAWGAVAFQKELDSNPLLDLSDKELEFEESLGKKAPAEPMPRNFTLFRNGIIPGRSPP